ncbi:MAG TPA: hypothetical protein VK131_04010 [Candidatus Acidoferrales bacterium]|nr:hypothetical protein [Candidatus Acidoferrales bacterium]
MLTEPRTPLETARPAPAQKSVVVVMPMVGDPDWSIFEELSEEVPIVVADDSGGKLSPAPRRNVRFFDYEEQKRVMGRHYDAIPHRSSASRNFGHYLAYREGYEVIVALDYDCRTRPGWLEEHLAALGPKEQAPALAGRWINSIQAEGFYARGFPYEYRDRDQRPVKTQASGEVKLNLGVWDNVLDLNGIDKLQSEPPREPGLLPGGNHVALGNLPLCGMNTAFLAELTPAYFFLPDVWVDGWQLSRHDDIWGGYILKKLMDRRGDLVSFGGPVVEHTRQSNLQRVIAVEHYMHLLARPFYEVVDEVAEGIPPGPYPDMFAQFCDGYLSSVEASRGPAHYRRALAELGRRMRLWAGCFR